VADDLITLIDSSLTTSTGSADENAGNIDIRSPVALILLGDSVVSANAAEGQGGAVTISTDTLIADGSPGEIITATSDRGVDFQGEISINSAGADIGAGLANLPAEYFDATTVLSKPCAERRGSDYIRLYSRRYQVLPDSPYALRSYFPNLSAASRHSAQRSGIGSNHGPKLALRPLSSCTDHG
jgi:hypothetical protein